MASQVKGDKGDKGEASPQLSLNHPTAGRSRVDLSIFAIRWHASAAPPEKDKLLEELGLSRVQTGKPEDAPLVAVLDEGVEPGHSDHPLLF